MSTPSIINRSTPSGILSNAGSSKKGSNSSKRSSTRTVVISKAMRVVDADTRAEEAQRRLIQLDRDAYMQELSVLYGGTADGDGGPSASAAAVGDEEYELSDVCATFC